MKLAKKIVSMIYVVGEKNGTEVKAKSTFEKKIKQRWRSSQM
jgi:hypothetical protein